MKRPRFLQRLLGITTGSASGSFTRSFTKDGIVYSIAGRNNFFSCSIAFPSTVKVPDIVGLTRADYTEDVDGLPPCVLVHTVHTKEEIDKMRGYKLLLTQVAAFSKRKGRVPLVIKLAERDNPAMYNKLGFKAVKGSTKYMIKKR